MKTAKLTTAQKITAEAHAKAKDRSISGNRFYVVYIPDQGTEVFDAQQRTMYADQIFVEAC